MTTLTTHLNAIIAERGWTADLDKITDTHHHRQSHADHRSVLAHELSQLDIDPTWKEIATCLGFTACGTAEQAASRHVAAEKRLKLARDRKRAVNYGMTL